MWLLKKCRCNNYHDVRTIEDLSKRTTQTGKLQKKLTFHIKHLTGEHQLYKCTYCEQFWQKSNDDAYNNREYFFKVPIIIDEDWLARPFVQPHDLLRRLWPVIFFLEYGMFEEQNLKCKEGACDVNAIKLSVFCAYHHLVHLGAKIELPENNTWFEPYFEKDFTFSLNFIKANSLYQPLNVNAK